MATTVSTRISSTFSSRPDCSTVGCRSRLPEKCPRSRAPKTTRRIIPDLPRPRIKQRPTHLVRGLNRHEYNQLVLRRFRFVGFQRPAIRQPQHIRQHVIRSPFGHVQSRVRRINRHSPANRVEDRIARQNAFERMKYRWMIRDHEITIVRPAFLRNSHRIIDGQQYATIS